MVSKIEFEGFQDRTSVSSCEQNVFGYKIPGKMHKLGEAYGGSWSSSVRKIIQGPHHELQRLPSLLGESS